MSIEGLLISLVLVAAVGLLTAAPLLRRGAGRKSDDFAMQKQHERLLIYYERVLTNIRDLDEDFATGKMLEGDYQAEREEWVQRGIQVLKALDQQEIIPLGVEDDIGVDEAVDEAIEAAIKAYKDLTAKPS